jgi:hypothetical protein
MSEAMVPATVVPAPVVRGSGMDIVYVLTLIQVGSVLLAAVGEVLLMGGNGAYLLIPVVKSVLLLVFATGAVRRRRWALRALVVLSWVTLSGFVLQLLVGLVAPVEFTVNIVDLMTTVGIPVAVIWLCRPQLRAIRLARREARAARLAVVYPPVMHGPPIAPGYTLPTTYGEARR